MRRFVTAALLALFVCQSSGAAVAASAPASNATPLLAQLQLEFSQVLGQFQSTHVGAFLTGRESLYESMHAPPPDFTRVREETRRRVRIVVRHPSVSPAFRTGITLYPQMKPESSIDMRNLPRDPLAMPHGLRPPALRGRTAISTMTVGAVNGSGTTGINPWWTYEEGAVPGVGKWMVNAGTGNLLVQETPIDIPERGIDLAFRMTYNSQSQHDYANTDGSTPSNYGNGWTNTFDAHLGYNAAANTMTVWDIDGAAYTYSSNGAGGWNPPPGQHAQLAAVGGCGYQWTKKTGTVYWFFSPIYGSSSCAGSGWAGYDGRLYEILGRNHNNYLAFNYSWDTSNSTNTNLNQITVTHSDGQQLILKFADWSGYRELTSITRPDGAQVTFQYDGSGDLQWVAEPTNNSNYGSHEYQYWSGQPHQLMNIVSPLWAQSGGAAGAAPTFWEDSSYRATRATLYAFANFTPSDGTGVALQPGLTTNYIALNSTSFSYPSAGETQLTDADGHATNWFYDSAGRVTQTQEWTGAPNNLWLTTTANWDSSDNLTETTDARGNATDYGYDGNGNTIWVQQPYVTTSLGSGRPVARYAYDGNNNLVAYCDQQYVWTTGATSCSALVASRATLTVLIRMKLLDA
jgi:YD repeat-containing protein